MTPAEYFKYADSEHHYSKSLRGITGSVTSAILLNCFVSSCDDKPFYRFKEPCNHPDYKNGCSWTENLGFSSREFDTALNKIGTRICNPASNSTSKSKYPTLDELNFASNENLILYWVDLSRKTWYWFNKELFDNQDSLEAKHNASVSLKYNRTKPERTIYKPRSGYVYLIHAVGCNRYKIGLSQNPQRRKADIQKQSPFELEIVHQIETEDSYGLEEQFHERFAEKRVNGEWFELNGDDITWIKGQ